MMRTRLAAILAVTLVACAASDDDADETTAETQDPLVFGGYCINVVSPNTCDPSVFCGDLNADRKVSVTDGILAQRMAAAGGFDWRADVNGDGRVTVTDATLILQKAAGNHVTFACKRR